MILADYCCYECRLTFEQMVESPSPDKVWCHRCDSNWALWSPSPVRGRVRLGEVERGGVDKPDSPMYLDTRELGAGMPMEEWRAKRDKLYQERRHKESKEI